MSSSEMTIRWLTQVAHLLRGEDLAASSAHVIEAVRLAEALSALRAQPVPGLVELNEAVRAVFCFGDDLPLRLTHEKLIVGERLGHVAEDAPMTPLQARPGSPAKAPAPGTGGRPTVFCFKSLGS